MVKTRYHRINTQSGPESRLGCRVKYTPNVTFRAFFSFHAQADGRGRAEGVFYQSPIFFTIVFP